MKFIGILLLLVGACLFVYSLEMSPYQDEKVYMDEYLSINRTSLGREIAMEQFYELRLSQLTPKYKIQDYALSILSLGGIFIISFWKGIAFVRAPNSRLQIIILTLFAVLTTIGAIVGYLYLEFARGSFPHWADSLGIPLMGVPLMLIILLVWATVNLLGLKGKFKVGARLFEVGFKGANYWYMAMATITGLIVLMVLIYGSFWLVIPGFLWFYFYLSLLAGRYSANH